MNEIERNEINKLQKLIIYDLCYSNTWLKQIEEYESTIGNNIDSGAVFFIRLFPEKKYDTDYILQYVRELSSDLFPFLIIGNKRENEVVCIFITEIKEVIERRDIVEKCSALYERLVTILGFDMQIGIGRNLPKEKLKESLEDAINAIEKANFSIIHYSDLLNDTKTDLCGTLARFFKYLQVNYSRQISLDQVAKAVCVSPNYLSAKLKEETGKTYIAHLTEYRISAAKELLLKTNQTAKAIGERVGYPDAIYFTRVFKKQTGMTPAEYRDYMENSL